MCRWEFVNHKKLMPRKSRFLALASGFEEYLVLGTLYLVQLISSLFPIYFPHLTNFVTKSR